LANTYGVSATNVALHEPNDRVAFEQVDTAAR
jgi:hypothetical protein